MKKFRNILAMLMVFVMLVAVMPMNVFAEGEKPGTEEPVVTEIKEVKITSDITGELKAGDSITTPTLTVEGDNATVTFGQWYKGDAEASGTFEEGSYTYTFTIAPKENAQFADNLTVTLNGAAVTATETDGQKVYRSAELEVKPADTTKPDEGDKKPDEGDKKPDDKPDTKPVLYNVYKGSTVHGSFTVSPTSAKEKQTITVTATPNAGYAVKSVYYYTKDGTRVNLRNNPYNDYYYYGYYDRYYDGYYGDYYRYYSEYENNYYYNKYSSYDAFLRAEHYSFWNNGYRYWDDYDYKYLSLIHI